MRQEGYAIGTINLRLATIRTYCELACNVRAISEEAYKLIQTVKGYTKERRNIDDTRATQGIPTRKSTKKVMSVPVTTTQASRLKQATMHIDRQRPVCDLPLSAKDALMMGFFIEHALRVSEVWHSRSSTLTQWRELLRSTARRRRTGKPTSSRSIPGGARSLSRAGAVSL